MVIAITDGDTLTALCEEQQVKVRIAAIDAPERKQPYGTRARQALADLCFRQQAVITPKGRDRYGRTLADVQCKGQDVGSWMVRNGWAMAYIKYDTRLVPNQDAARAEHAGQWQGQPVPPWEWRKLPKQ